MPAPDRHWPRADVWLAQDSSDPEILVVGVPNSKASLSPSRADLFPMALRDRLHRFTTFHGEWSIDFGDVRVRDAGNWPVSELEAPTMPPMVEELAAEMPPVPLRIFLGGDNAITRPLVASLSDDLSRVGLLTFDAHHDVRTLETGPSNGNPIRGLIEERSLPGENVAQIGIHSFANAASHHAYCEKAGIAVATMDQIDRDGVEAVVDQALAGLESRCDVIYVDVDIDVLDRAFAPACPGARPGGMSVRQLAAGVRRCARHPRVAAVDIVEVDPTADSDGQTLDAAAHVLLSVVAGFAERP